MKSYTFRQVAIGLAALVLVLVLCPQVSKAVEVPEPGDPLQIQTSGPTTPLGIGDWYSHVTGDNTYHMLVIPVPDTYPATQDITIQLYDPECYNAGGQIYDEIRGAADTTRFLLLAPDGVTVVQDTTSTMLN